MINIKNIALWDTSVGSENGGDKIIMEYCNEIVRSVIPNSFTFSVPTHGYLDEHFKNKVKFADTSIVCGTNLLSSNMDEYNQWKIKLKDIKDIDNICLLGVGWWQYQPLPNRYTSRLLHTALDNKYLHSVRDVYTYDMLNKIGIKNVVYTGCPTMWNLSEKICDDIPKKKATDVITTLTNYHQNPEEDRFMLNTLVKQYRNVYFWIQAFEDVQYLKNIDCFDLVQIIAPSLQSFDEILDSDLEIDYVGTRLHAGIRALNHKRRTIIVGKDNRAVEIAKSTNLNVIPIEDLCSCLVERINDEVKTRIILPYDNIEKWKKQFREVQNGISG